MNLITDLKTGKDFCVRAKSQTDGIRLFFSNMTIREEPVRSSYQKGLKSKYDARFSGHLVGTVIGEYEERRHQKGIFFFNRNGYGYNVSDNIEYRLPDCK